ncbi:MurR/RpiR family transcriptional regulator [Oharaeibacter diazotrophicus]|uniref:RpiR family transcriptional regulator n=1 Tax=Oharaeibacter diazotrophicus TaxID=1920512 RepID=A0A4R6RCZ5_9HYPH|nr:MurR/RpiR family transcriptional regulator [Oharaeibacter diazotrophicus]TDP83587.1 RpiR family transcriptional regulator [Oharaeibacter diazotrophicus]BBE72420.1 DNA-binding transcriptional regulator HexR [Pleomorphomonas sp. SM30]GLS79190.1 RpiR family transcriptional regulator [Oharaeibacter diazotrophicus]
MNAAGNGDLTIGERIREEMHRFTPTERKAAHVLLANYPVAGLETVAEFARRAAVSAPTVLRFVGRLGFSSYPDFQRALRDELDKQSQSPLMKARFAAPEAAVGGSYELFAGALAQNLAETFRHLPVAEFEAVVDALADRKRSVTTVGGRFTDSLARHLAVHLKVVRAGVTHLDGQIANWRDHLVDLGPKDLLVLFDIRRYQDDLLVFAEAAARRGVTVILFTDQWLSPVTRHARHIVSARVAVPSRWDSLTAMLGLVEALLAAVTEKTWEEASRRIAAIDAIAGRAKAAP